MIFKIGAFQKLSNGKQDSHPDLATVKITLNGRWRCTPNPTSKDKLKWQICNTYLMPSLGETNHFDLNLWPPTKLEFSIPMSMPEDAYFYDFNTKETPTTKGDCVTQAKNIDGTQTGVADVDCGNTGNDIDAIAFSPDVAQFKVGIYPNNDQTQPITPKATIILNKNADGTITASCTTTLKTDDVCGTINPHFRSSR